VDELDNFIESASRMIRETKGAGVMVLVRIEHGVLIACNSNDEIFQLGILELARIKTEGEVEKNFRLADSRGITKAVVDDLNRDFEGKKGQPN
jgi:hypothetical protein